MTKYHTLPQFLITVIRQYENQNDKCNLEILEILSNRLCEIVIWSTGVWRSLDKNTKRNLWI